MSEKAQGHWPPNVTAVIISEEEKQSRLAQAPPGGTAVANPITVNRGAQPVPGAPHATVETRYVINGQSNNTPINPGVNSMSNSDNGQTLEHNNSSNTVQANSPESQALPASNEQLTGKAALIAANKMGVEWLWKTADRQPIDIPTAIQLIQQDPNSVYFDFDLASELPDEEDEEDEEVYNAELETAIADREAAHPEEPESVPSIPTPLPPHRQGDTLPPSDVPLPPNPNQPQVQFSQRQHSHISDRERLAWGGVLQTPGQTVYFRPGVIRVEVEGRVVVQKGQAGNVRMLRVTRAEPGMEPVQLASATQTGVVPPLTKSPNPQVVYRQSTPAPDKFPIPQPKVKVPDVQVPETERTEIIDESEF